MIKIFLLSNNVESAKEEKRGEERKKKNNHGNHWIYSGMKIILKMNFLKWPIFMQ